MIITNLTILTSEKIFGRSSSQKTRNQKQQSSILLKSSSTMASLSTLLPNPNLISKHNSTLSSTHPCAYSWKNKTPTSKGRFSVSCSSSSQAYDVVVVGAGVIGLTIARHFLVSSDLSVAVVDKAVPCSGATGAGITIYKKNTMIVFFFFSLWEKKRKTVIDTCSHAHLFSTTRTHIV